MPTQVTNHKCPACTGPLHFEGATGKLKCDYCESRFEVAEIEAMYAQAEQAAQQAHAQAQAEQEAREEARTQDPDTPWDTSDFEQWGLEPGMRSYSCPSCGAQLICEETTGAASCPYCGNPTVIPGQFAGGLKPNFVIPFKLDQKAAEAALKNYYQGKKFLPDGFASANRIREIRGVYVPFWLFDGEAEADARFRATNTRTYTRGDFAITETDHYHVRRAGSVPFEKIPVDASSKMPNAHMDAIEPFDYSELQPFSTAYLPGFLADRYDVTAESSAARADDRAGNTALAAMQGDVIGYATCVRTEQKVTLHRGKVHYALLPVYMLATQWQGQSYLFAMNGQTGKLIGDLPVDRKKYWAWFAGIAAGVTAVLGTFLMLVL